MVGAATFNETKAKRPVNCLEMVVYQRCVPPEMELQQEPLPDAFENPVGIQPAFKPQSGLDDHEAGAQSEGARHTANRCAAEQYPIRHARSNRTRRSAATSGASSCALEHDGG